MTSEAEIRARVVPLRAVCQELDTLWDESARTDFEPAHRQGVVTRALYDCALQVMTSTRGSYLLLDRGGVEDAITLTRRAFEFGVTAQWLLKNDEPGLRSLEAETERVSRLAVMDLMASGAPVPADVIAAVEGGEMAAAEAAAFRRFQGRCAEFSTGTELYVMYRHLSTWCHPNVPTIYRLMHEAGGIHETVSPAAMEFACSLGNTMAVLLAMRAADERTKFKPWKRQLRAAGRRLDLPTLLTPAPPPAKRPPSGRRPGREP